MDKVEVYEREGGGFDWRRKAENGEVIATSGGQGYADKDFCVDMARSVNAEPYELVDLT